MAQPPPYNRSFSFTNYQTSNPTTPLPGNSLDIELNAVKTTLDALDANIGLIQNDDGTLKNASVGVNQLAPSLIAGFSSPTAWLTGTMYTASPASTVFQSSKIYTCLISHTSGVFATDLSAGRWQLILDLTTIPITAASQVSFTPGGGLASTDVQDALVELGNGKAATSHTHASTAISDSTAAGRAMLTAANVAAQQSLLGLGSLAFLNSVTITNLSQNLTLTGVISPAALAANTNDWAPTGLSAATVIKLSASSAINLTGISGGADGRVLVLQNTGSNAITLTGADTNSASANRFATASVLQPGTVLALIYDGTASLWRIDAMPRNAPTPQVYTTGSGTYNTPTLGAALPLYLRVRIIGGGGGGGGATANAGGGGGTTTFGSWTAIGGGGGNPASGQGGGGGSGGTNGTGTLVTRLAGSLGGGGQTTALSVNMAGGMGASGPWGGAGSTQENQPGIAGTAGTGAGGGGGGGASSATGAGGGSGEYVEFIVPNPAGSYSYAVGTAGTAGAAGGTAGGAGATGRIEIWAHWQ